MTNLSELSSFSDPRLLLEHLEKELRQRQRHQQAQQSLLSFIEYLDLTPPPAEHHRLIARELEAVERRDIDRLMLFLPPGSAKSTYASVLFPPWLMGRNPQEAIIAVSHTAELAERFGRRVRNIVGSPDFRNLFGFGLSSDSQAAGRWDNERGGEYYAVGLGGSVTGRRADLALIDDPVASREKADSDTEREKAWQWYVNDLLTRLKPGARQILVMTRWHEDDLGGRILDREGHKWRIVKLPMIADTDDPLGRKPGERLWAEWFTDDMIDSAKQDMRAWNALYQQDPTPDDGEFFKREWFGEYETPPENLNVYGASDYAVTADGGDFTEHGVFGIDAQSNIYVLDWWRGQTDSAVWIDAFIDIVLKHKPIRWFGESGVIRKAVEPFMVKRMTERNAYAWVEWLPSINDKPTRARGIQARASMGKVWFPRRAVWKDDVLSQLLKFPQGKHDDSVDVLSLLGRGLDQTVDATPKKEVFIDSTSWMG